MNDQYRYPALPLEEWEPTKITLHLFTQIVGKIRMNLMPPQNHWWHVPLYVHTRGLSTGPMPANGKRIEILFNFESHNLEVFSGDKTHSFTLKDGLSVAAFYRKLFAILEALDINVEIWAVPYDHDSTTPFPEDEQHHSYDREYIERYWTILLHTDRIFRRFSGRFLGKSCPVQLYWHSFDLAVTRFSGRTGPEMPEAGRVEREAYSHEVISFGFWPGDTNFQEPAFYSYTFPAPDEIGEEPLEPEEAQWIEQNGSPMALLRYEDIRQAGDPGQVLLAFLESAYRAGARTAGWDMEELAYKEGD